MPDSKKPVHEQMFPYEGIIKFLCPEPRLQLCPHASIRSPPPGNVKLMWSVGTVLLKRCQLEYRATKFQRPWWRHQMEAFSALLALWAGNSPVPGEFPSQRPETRSFDVFFDQRLNKRMSEQSWGWWFETLSRPLWRHSNAHKHSNSNIRNENFSSQSLEQVRRSLRGWNFFQLETASFGLEICLQRLMLNYSSHTKW